ncbi:MAG: cellulase family glycosylhydrolase [Legionellales bacterium]|nr:cellulase family glycosylhydrolase [Legionellales bacterium]
MKRPLSLLIIWVLATTSHAAMITNAIQGVGPNGSIRPYLCLQNADGAVTLALAPDQSGDANLASGQPDRARAHLRFAGCDTKHEDLGAVELAIGQQIPTPSVLSYTAPDGIHIAYINANMNAQGKIMGNIVYTSIQANFNLNPVKSTQHTMFTGVNLSGLEFGQAILPSTIPNLSQQDADTPYSDLADIQSFIHAGMNTVRIPISWNYLQWNGPGRTIINQDYYSNYIKPLLETLTSAKVYTILNLHCNMHYALYGQSDSICPKYGYCPSGTLILDESAYTYVWGQLWQQIQQDAAINPDYLLLDLVNAPVHIPDDKVLTIQTTLIKHLRESGFPGYILVQGNAGSELHTWTTHQWMSQDGQSLSNASLFTRDNFLQAGVSDLSKILISVRQYLDEGYQGTHSDCSQDLHTTGPDGFNLEAFTQYLKENQLQAIVTAVGVSKNACACTTPLTQFMTYLQQNAADKQPFGFVGWVMWGVGHAWGDYPLRFTPDSELMQVLDPFITG